MTSRTVTLNNQQEYGLNDIGDVLSPRATDSFSLLDFEDVLNPPKDLPKGPPEDPPKGPPEDHPELDTGNLVN